MSSLHASPNLALIVPFHNEEQLLPCLIESLRAQTVQDIPIVFIDSVSTDRSVTVVQQCQEVKTGKWICIKEKILGKVHAVKTATAVCTEQFGVENVGCLDADSYLGDPTWLGIGVEIVARAAGCLGYTYSPFAYFGFDGLPVFKSAYLAYEQVLHFLVENVGWLANGLGFICSVEVLKQYFRKAQLMTEFDLRCSLLALSQGRKAYFNSGVLFSSGRRIIVNSENFAAWCFYEREFYSKKDVNAPEKLNLNAPTLVEDLPHEKVEQFFARRAMKITCRHLIPLAIFDRSSYYLERIKSVLGLDVEAKLNLATRRIPENTGYLFTDAFETMIKAIERDPASIAVANYLHELMLDRYKREFTTTAKGSKLACPSVTRKENIPIR